jgi:hypothetical protein
MTSIVPPLTIEHDDSHIVLNLNLPLTAEDLERVTAAITAALSQIEWERTVPAHVCEQDHGQMGYLHRAICMAGCKLEGLEGSTEADATANAGKAVRAHIGRTQHEVIIASDVDGPMWIDAPTCHDCGASLIRPRGNRDDCWVCPTVHGHEGSLTIPAGAAFECGHK